MEAKAASEAAPLLPAKAARDPHLDNAKWLCMMLVISGHILGALPRVSAYYAAYSAATWLHIPLFAMLAGAMSKRPPTVARAIRVLQTLGLPLVFVVFVINIVSFPVGYLAHYGFFGMDGGDREYLKAVIAGARKPFRDPVGALLFFQGPGAIWYLRCLLLWKLDPSDALLSRAPALAKPALVAAVSCAALYAPSDCCSVWRSSVGYSGGAANFGPFACVRAALLWPFFYAGQKLDWRALGARYPTRPAGDLAPLVFYATVVCAVAYRPLDWVLPSIGTDADEPFTSYVPLCAAEAAVARAAAGGRALVWRDCGWGGLLLLPARYAGELAFRGAGALAFFLCCVPRDRTWFTAAGGRTLYPYLLHDRTRFTYHLGVALAPIFTWGGIDNHVPWANTMRTLGARQLLALSAVVAGQMALATGVMLLFTCTSVRYVARPFIEPYPFILEAWAWGRARASGRDDEPPRSAAAAVPLK